MSTSRLAFAGALPALVFATTLAAGGSLLAMGAISLQPVPPLTLSEAAALHDEAEMIRLIEAGADPNVPSHVRAGIIRDREFSAPPIEAAIAARRVDSLRLLTGNGAIVHEGNLPRLWCLAQMKEDKDLVAFFDRWRTDAATVDCSRVTAPW